MSAGTACAPKHHQTKLSLVSGDYRLVETYRNDPMTGSVSTPITERITLSIRPNEIQVESVDGQSLSTTISLLPENQWLKDCPVGMSWDVSETYSIDDGFIFGEFEFGDALLYPACPNKGTRKIHISAPNASGQSQYCKPGPCLIFERLTVPD